MAKSKSNFESFMSKFSQKGKPSAPQSKKPFDLKKKKKKVTIPPPSGGGGVFGKLAGM